MTWKKWQNFCRHRKKMRALWREKPPFSNGLSPLHRRFVLGAPPFRLSKKRSTGGWGRTGKAEPTTQRTSRWEHFETGRRIETPPSAAPMRRTSAFLAFRSYGKKDFVNNCWFNVPWVLDNQPSQLIFNLPLHLPPTLQHPKFEQWCNVVMEQVIITDTMLQPFLWTCTCHNPSRITGNPIMRLILDLFQTIHGQFWSNNFERKSWFWIKSCPAQISMQAQGSHHGYL